MKKPIRKDNDLLKEANKILDKTEPKPTAKQPKKSGWHKLIGRRLRKFNKNHPWLTTVDIPSATTFQQQDIANRAASFVAMINGGRIEQTCAATYAVALFNEGVNQDRAIKQGFLVGERQRCFSNWYMQVRNDAGEICCDGWIDDSSGLTAHGAMIQACDGAMLETPKRWPKGIV